MSETCPLSSSVDPEDKIRWDTGIPVDCLSCIYQAFDNGKVHVTDFTVQGAEQVKGNQETWHCRGVKILDAHGGREAIEEVGIDINGNNQECPLTHSVVRFVCDK